MTNQPTTTQASVTDEKRSSIEKGSVEEHSVDIPDNIHGALEFPTEQELETLRRVADTVPWNAYLIALIELAERFSFYGSSVVFTNFIQQKLPPGSHTGAGFAHGQSGALGKGQRASTGLTTFYQFCRLKKLLRCYVTPLLGAYIADTYLGRFNTICIAVAIALLGHIILIVSAVPGFIENSNGALVTFVIALIVMGLGTGLFKSNISPLIAEQYKRTRLFVITTKKGERVIVDPAMTISRVYMYVGFWLAYTLPTIIFLFCPIVLFFGRNRYVRTPPTGSILLTTFRLWRHAARGRWSLNPVKMYRQLTAPDFWENAKPSKYIGEKPKWITFDDQWVDEINRGLKACAVFCWYPIYWLAYNQLKSNLTSQAATMSTHGLPNDVLSNLDPLALVIFIPICDLIIYPALRRGGVNFSALRKITAGFVSGSAAMIWAAVVQHYIYKTGSEIFASITGLEYAFTKAPGNMRSLVMAVFLFTSAVSAALGEAFVLWNYGVMAILAGITGIIFWLHRPELANTARRRLSLTAIFNRNSPFPRSTPLDSVISAAQPSSSIPADIVREIVNFLPPADVLSFSLTSSTVRNFLLPVLYESVSLKSSRQCQVTLSMLCTHPEICAHIRSLSVRPNYYLAWPKPDKALDEGWVAGMISQIAEHLTLLNTFDWDGLEAPLDSMWMTLRKCCPELRHIFSNVGVRPIEPDSQLFQFSDLKSFSLIVRYGLLGTDLFPPSETLPTTFWDMIICRCPNLEELAICSFSSSARVFDVLPITAGRWSKLQTLTLGSFGYQADFSLGAAEELSFSVFLDNHPVLKYLRLQWNFKRWMSPTDLRLELSPNALPELDTFVGIYQQLAKLPNRNSIETLDLTCEPLHEYRLTQICPLLQSLTSLTSLDLWTHVTGQDNTLFFSSIFLSCPKLTDLHYMSTMTFPMKTLKQLLSQLHWLPDLKRFSLTKGHRYGDESMLDSALLILRFKPTLEEINIRWAREKAPNHLKQEGTYSITSNEGQPSFIIVHEQGIPLVGRTFDREYKYILRPSGLAQSLKQRHLFQILRIQR
ncbi:hypothetical protein C0995_007266 [Termitomyces sp. Mi166|nr:hypothetical protein C0995_007266 [Termitomyces sp. Mi166\